MLVFGAAILTSANVAVNAQYGNGGYGRQDARHHRRDDRRDQRRYRASRPPVYYGNNGYYNNNGYYDRTPHYRRTRGSGLGSILRIIVGGGNRNRRY